MMDVITREADDVNALTTDDKYFKIAPVISPIYTVLTHYSLDSIIPNYRQNSIDVEIVKSHLMNERITILHKHEDEVHHSSPTNHHHFLTSLQIQPDILLEDWHVLVRLHQLLNCHSSGCDHSTANYCKNSRINRKVTKRSWRRASQLDGGYRITHQQHCCPMNARQSSNQRTVQMYFFFRITTEKIPTITVSKDPNTWRVTGESTIERI